VKTIKSATAEGWAGTTIGTAAGFINNIPLTLTDSKMSVRVWSATAGTLVRLKVEAATNATHTCETQTTTTLAGAWEVLEFDFANEAPGTAMLSTGIDGGWTYNKASIFFNYDIPGTQAGELTFYFDDVYFGEIEVGTAEITASIANAYPNPTSDAWTISSEDMIQQVMVMNTQGQVVLSIDSNEHQVSIDAADLAKGVYFAQVITNKGMTSIQLQKQ
ncbi:MAG: T9SS type A sorting domain-containing protein, partial [Flavobacteriales bacterium]|nr:T9SS type A sorting domain-containing protein [Flavobacteriales bacterium]